MNQPHEPSPPMIEITISRTALRLCCAAVPIGLFILLSVIGAAASPMVDGHPVILTRERLAIRQYLDAADDWIQRMDDIMGRLDVLVPASALTPTGSFTVAPPSSAISITLAPTGSLPSHIALPPQTQLPVLSRPSSRPGSLYDRAQQAERAMQDLQAIDLEWQHIETPAALSGLHALANDTLQALAQWATQVIETIDAPSPDSLAAIQSARQAALTSLETLRRALATQQGAAR